MKAQSEIESELSRLLQLIDCATLLNLTKNTIFSNLPDSSYFLFLKEEDEPKSPENLDCDVWQKCSMRKIRKYGEQKIYRFGRYITPVYLVAKTLDELIECLQRSTDYLPTVEECAQQHKDLKYTD